MAGEFDAYISHYYNICGSLEGKGGNPLVRTDLASLGVSLVTAVVKGLAGST